ncbi:MAG: hypothetical protein AAF633_00375 [Chloroflexota bacterium]
MQVEKIRETTELAGLADHLVSLNLSVEINDESDGMPATTILVHCTLTNGVQQIISISYLPEEEGDFEQIKLLQLHTHLPIEFEPDSETVADLTAHLMASNDHLLFGQMGISYDQSKISYRYVYAQPRSGMLNHIILQEIFFIFLFTVEEFTTLIKAYLESDEK